MPHRPRASHLATVIGALHPAAVGPVAPVGGPCWGCTRSDTPGYGDTPSCRASEAAEDLPRGPLVAHCASSAFCPSRAACFSRTGVLARPSGGTKADSGSTTRRVSVGCPAAGLRYSPPLPERGGPVPAVPARGVRGPSLHAAGAAPRALPWPAAFRQGRAPKAAIAGWRSSELRSLRSTSHPRVAYPCCLRGGRSEGFSG